MRYTVHSCDEQFKFLRGLATRATGKSSRPDEDTSCLCNPVLSSFFLYTRASCGHCICLVSCVTRASCSSCLLLSSYSSSFLLTNRCQSLLLTIFSRSSRLPSPSPSFFLRIFFTLFALTCTCIHFHSPPSHPSLQSVTFYSNLSRHHHWTLSLYVACTLVSSLVLCFYIWCILCIFFLPGPFRCAACEVFPLFLHSGQHTFNGRE